MSIIEQEIKTTLTVPHLRLIEALEHLDVEIVVEGQFPRIQLIVIYLTII